MCYSAIIYSLLSFLIGNQENVESPNMIVAFSQNIESMIEELQPLQNSFWLSILVLLIVYIIKHFALRTPSVSNNFFCALIEFPNDVCIALIPIIIAWGAKGGKEYTGFYFVLVALILNVSVLLGRHHSAKNFIKERWLWCTIIPIGMYTFIVFFVSIIYSLL